MKQYIYTYMYMYEAISFLNEGAYTYFCIPIT